MCRLWIILSRVTDLPGLFNEVKWSTIFDIPSLSPFHVNFLSTNNARLEASNIISSSS